MSLTGHWSHDYHVIYGYREKQLLISGASLGRDLVGVQNLLKKHSRVEAEISSHCDKLEVSHTPHGSSSHDSMLTFQSVLTRGGEVGGAMPPEMVTIQDRCSQLRSIWEKLTSSSHDRSVFAEIHMHCT